jgi:hypothetical protein
MHAAQYVPEGEVEVAKIALTVAIFLICGRSTVCRIVLRLARVNVAARMPRGMHQRTLLRDQQQGYA